MHSLIVEGVERYAAYEEQMSRLVKEAIASDAQIQRLGEVYRASGVPRVDATPCAGRTGSAA